MKINTGSDDFELLAEQHYEPLYRFALSTAFHKYNHVCGEGFLAQTRRERRAYPSAVCKERATTSGPKRTAARRVASLFGSGFVAPRSQPHCGGCSLVAPRQNRKSTQQTWSYLWNGVLRPKAIAPIVAVCLSLLWPRFAYSANSLQDVKIDIPYKKFVLTNGLTLIVHEDHKAPIVAVNLWYHVGSKNEKLGKTGFAHLFEHLMFTGSEHFKGGSDQRAFFEAMERIGRRI